jgi:hypothetical protein
MSVPEVAFRIGRTIHVQSQRCGLLRDRAPADADLAKRGVHLLSIPVGVDPEGYREAADRVLAGQVDFLGPATLEVGFPPEWNRNAKSGRRVPLRFGKTLNYRDQQLGGDVKYLWVPNRHLQLVRLAQAYALTDERRYLQGIGTLLASWLDSCPYPLGANWTSSLEAALRLINWSITWQLIGGPESPLFQDSAGHRLRRLWLQSVYRHLQFIRGHLSRYSSANNHLIGELAGIIVGSATWPHWHETELWLDRARSLLERETQLQNTSDGVNREQSTFYQTFVLDFLLLAGLYAGAAGSEMSAAYWERCERMLEYLASIMDVEGHMPQIGDADDGYVVRLSAEAAFCPFRSLLATGAVLFQNSALKAKARRLDDKTLWLLGPDSREQFAALGRVEQGGPIRRSFPQGGYYLLGENFDQPREVKMLVDAGPLGYPSIAAHGHADALSIYLSLGGQEILIDPGTFAYQSEEHWRRYFRGSSAHNTLVVDGRDQSVMGGKFMWLKAAKAACESFEPIGSVQRFQGWQDGYKRLADPVHHQRRIAFRTEQNQFEIRDELECRSTHTVERFWHFSEHCEVRLDKDIVSVTASGVSLILTTAEPCTLELHRGSEDPPLGWRSHTFMSKIPICTVVMRNTIGGRAALTSILTYKLV